VPVEVLQYLDAGYLLAAGEMAGDPEQVNLSGFSQGEGGGICVTLMQLITDWVALGIFSGLLGGSVGMMYGLGPFAKRKPPAAFATFLFIVGMTGTLVFGKQNLLQATITFFTGG
jgi:hypothetical protein